MVNKVALLGRVGKDPVIKSFNNGGKVAEFSIATDDSYKDKSGNKVEQTDWHNIRCTYPKLCDVIESYVKRGSLLYVEGKIKTRSWDDKDGNKRYATEVVIESLKLLGGKDGAGHSEAAGTSQNQHSSEDDGDNLPF